MSLGMRELLFVVHPCLASHVLPLIHWLLVRSLYINSLSPGFVYRTNYLSSLALCSTD